MRRLLASSLMRFAVPWVVSLCASVLAWPAELAVRYKLTPRETVAASVAAALMGNSDRGARLRSMFAEAGCPADEQPVKHAKAPNVICTLPGETDSVILVGAHFDHAEKGLGVIDNWSGASLLPSLFESLKVPRRRHTLLFMINFDSIGAGPAEVEHITADRELLSRLLNVGAAMKLPIRYVNANQVGESDFAAFRAKGVPTLLFHSLTQDNLKLLHNVDDNAAALKMDDYYETYRIASVYLAYLDLVLGELGQADAPPARSLIRRAP